jgi:hypothetical protein
MWRISRRHATRTSIPTGSIASQGQPDPRHKTNTAGKGRLGGVPSRLIGLATPEVATRAATDRLCLLPRFPTHERFVGDLIRWYLNAEKNKI